MGLCIFGIIAIGLSVMALALGAVDGRPVPEILDPVYFQNYEVSSLADTPENMNIGLGYRIFRYTASYLGPETGDTLARASGNRLACANCHLDAGTRPYSAPLIGVVRRFPQYRGREDKMGTIEERINGCMERSMNGHTIPEDGEAMKALIAYMDWLGRMAPEDGRIAGTGFTDLEIPERAVDPVNGKRVFEQHCVLCHGSDGQGQWAGSETGYLYPPLWGEDSYNNGAGMTRVLTAAAFIKSNMPFGTATYERPVLTDAEAYDVAGFINMQQRPEKQNREADFPDKRRKPASTPYGPYSDPFPEAQHQMGPFQPIIAYYKETYNITKTN